MFLFNYFEQLLKNKIIEINGFYLYDELIDSDQLEDFSDLSILTFNELRDYFVFKEYYFIKMLNKNLKLNNQIKYKIFTDSPTHCFYVVNNTVTMEPQMKSITKGIGFFKKKEYSEKKKEIIKLKDLKQNNFGMLVDVRGDFKYIVGYDRDALKKHYDDSAPFKNPILFYGKILFGGKDPNGTSTPYGSSIIFITVTRKDVVGRNILYPILAYYSDKHKIISDRRSLSDDADNVWNKISSLSGDQNIKLLKFAPIDDFNDKITDPEEDDGRIYNSKQYQEISSEFINSIKNNTKLSQQQKLEKLREEDYTNWVYELKDSAVSEIKDVTDHLIENHKKFIKKDKNITNQELLSLASQLFNKRASEIDV
jgi:hypothetical protein